MYGVSRSRDHAYDSLQLLNNVGQLAANSQAFTLLSSRTLQHVMALTPDRTVALRLSFWLHNSLSSGKVVFELLFSSAN